MDIAGAKERFMQLWGNLGSEWGINRTMAQIHALLLLSPKPLCTDEVMEQLDVSRGNANMNLRELVAWGLVYREIKHGDRKDFFRAEKDVWKMAQRITMERRKRELDPMMRCFEELLQEVQSKKGEEEDVKAFKSLLTELQGLGRKCTVLLDLVLKLNQSLFFNPLMKLLKRRAP